ncbi:hypothetical protein LCGC14_1841970 [marine sediment metagenome]|uniref:Uncharacterized protein n=1 Tax=marine sediment metagenome TaxID=412755 RepID=A0A0F9GCY0_9ZZZZ
MGLRQFNQEELTVDGTVGGKSLTASKYAASGGWGSATKAIVQVLSASIRFRLDGTAPTSSTGFAESVGSSFELNGEAEILGFKAIRTSGSDAKIIVAYYRRM